jgi:hypothetical protein
VPTFRTWLALQDSLAKAPSQWRCLAGASFGLLFRLMLFARPFNSRCSHRRSYEDDEDNGEWFLYTGSGGRDLSGNKRTCKKQSHDQVFDKMNMALKISCIKGLPVRVVRSHKVRRLPRCCALRWTASLTSSLPGKTLCFRALATVCALRRHLPHREVLAC